MNTSLDVPKRQWQTNVGIRNGQPSAVAVSPLTGPAEDAGPWEPTVQEIISYQQLKPNWDGYGAEAPSRGVLQSAIGLAYVYLQGGVGPPQRVAPGVVGSVIFEWQDPDGAYVTVEIDAPLHAEVTVVEPGKAVQQWTLPTE